MQSPKTPMNQDFIDIECNAVQPHNVTHSAMHDYTVDDLTAQLNVKRRMVFSYAKTICEAWHWEPEAAFKPSFGKYSQRMLAEMKHLQQLGTDEYLKTVGQENQRPIAFKNNALAATNESTHLATLDQKISSLQLSAANSSSNLAERIRLKLIEISRNNQSETQRQSALDDAEIIAAENRGYEKALSIFEAEERAKGEALAQLRAIKIQQSNKD